MAAVKWKKMAAEELNKSRDGSMELMALVERLLRAVGVREGVREGVRKGVPRTHSDSLDSVRLRAVKKITASSNFVVRSGRVTLAHSHSLTHGTSRKKKKKKK